MACASRSSMRCALTRASSLSCTGRAGSRLRAAIWPARSPLISMLGPSGRVSAKPVPTSDSVPLNGTAMARASSCEGCSDCSVVASVHCWIVQRPCPWTWPALCCLLPSSASKACNSSVRGSSGRARSSSLSCRTGRWPSFQRPGSALASVTVTRAGWLLPLVCATASPLSAVSGAALFNADRSRFFVLACSSASGQASNGRSVARASSDCSRCAFVGFARSVARKAGCSSGPDSVALACHRLVSVLPCASSICACSGSGECVPICAAPLAFSRSQAATSLSTRCVLPSSSPRCRCARTPRSGLSPSAAV